MRSALKLNEDTREEVFLDILQELWKFNDEGIKTIAEEAGCHWVTLYTWKSGRTTAPRIDKLAAVARVLGYNIILQKTKAPVPVHNGNQSGNKYIFNPTDQRRDAVVSPRTLKKASKLLANLRRVK